MFMSYAFQAVEHAGAPAYDAILKLFENAPTPSIKVAAM
jgi:hypothetical protein